MRQCGPDLVELATLHGDEPDVLVATGGQLSAQTALAQPAVGSVAMDLEAFGRLVEGPLGPGLARHGSAPDRPASGHAVAEHQALDHSCFERRSLGWVPAGGVQRLGDDGGRAPLLTQVTDGGQDLVEPPQLLKPPYGSDKGMAGSHAASPLAFDLEMLAGPFKANDNTFEDEPGDCLAVLLRGRWRMP